MNASDEQRGVSPATLGRRKTDVYTRHRKLRKHLWASTSPSKLLFSSHFLDHFFIVFPLRCYTSSSARSANFPCMPSRGLKKQTRQTHQTNKESFADVIRAFLGVGLAGRNKPPDGLRSLPHARQTRPSWCLEIDERSPHHPSYYVLVSRFLCFPSYLVY